MFKPADLKPIFSNWGIPLRTAHFLIAYSGGLDSGVLAQSMIDLAGEHGFSLTLGHVNHRLRPGSDKDAEFCREFAARRGIALHTVNLDPEGRRGESIEAWARRERYAALEGLRRQVDAHWICTAHHADDQVETVLMRLIQRSPMISLAGVRPKWGKVLRPLLAYTREELHHWAERAELDWVDDPTNVDQRFLRNKLRHSVIAPSILEEGSAKESLLSLARLAQNYEARCAAAAQELLGLVSGGTIPGTVAVLKVALAAVDEDVTRLAMRMIVERFLHITIELSTSHWQNFRHFVRRSTVGKIFDLAEGVRVLMDRDKLVFFQANQWSPPKKVGLNPGTTRWGHHEFSLASMDKSPGETGLWVRSWQPSDRARKTPSGRPALVSDIYVNARLNRLEKVHWPLVVTHQDEVVWLPGLVTPHGYLEITPWRITWQTKILKR